MSRLFNGTSDLLGSSGNTTGITTYPFSMSVWLKPVTGANGTAMGLGTSGQSAWYALGQLSTPAGFGETSVNTTNDAISSAAITAGSWGHLAFVHASATSHICYVNGGSAATDVTNNTFPGSTLDTITVGALLFGGTNLSSFIHGQIGEVALWNIALTSGNVTSLAGGTSPPSISSGNLVHYWQIKGTSSPEPPVSGFGATSLTVTGTTPEVGDDPPVGGGTLHTSSISGTSSFSGSMPKRINKLLIA